MKMKIGRVAWKRGLAGTRLPGKQLKAPRKGGGRGRVCRG